MSRTKTVFINAISALVLSTFTIVLSFIAQRVFASTLSLEYMGINGLFTNITTMLGIVELGLGSAIIFHLYKPIKDKDEHQITSLLNFYRNGYRVVAALIAMLGLAILPFITLITGEVTINENIYIIFILFIIDIICSYLLTYKRSLLYADQKNYIINMAHLGYVAIMNSAQIVWLISTHNYYGYLLIKIIVRILENTVLTLIINKRYQFNINKDSNQIEISTRNDIIKKIKGLFFHKIGTFIVFGSDNIIISIFLGIRTVGLFNNYYIIISAIQSVNNQIFGAITTTIGNLVASDNEEKLFITYRRMGFINFWIASIMSLGFLLAANPFMTLWLGKQYLLTNSVVIALSINLFLQIMRSSNNSFKEAAGIFHEDRLIPIYESLINITASIIFLRYFGLAGVFMGTIVSNAFILFYSYPKFIYKKLFDKNYVQYFKELLLYIILASITAAISVVTLKALTIESITTQLAAAVLAALILPSLVLAIFYRKSEELNYFKRIAKKVLRKLVSR
ncbi:hypothetical protein CVV43_01650 [Candidatus Saccharibacteria bacterium HGW-Saccharibacteria-1]|jgi:O-antigen/teichoic acid export membrane protein|nr:MAG: hypothetical protein CVV43_01650 [Candidatus Saccharibacteria bacterium HGW-Saccharibacteria-1]